MNTENWNKERACSGLFITLQAIECHLKPSYRVKITRSTEAKIYFSIHAIGSTKAVYSTTIKAKDITSEPLFDNCINLIWQEINARKLTDLNNNNN